MSSVYANLNDFQVDIERTLMNWIDPREAALSYKQYLMARGQTFQNMIQAYNSLSRIDIDYLKAHFDSLFARTDPLWETSLSDLREFDGSPIIDASSGQLYRSYNVVNGLLASMYEAAYGSVPTGYSTQVESLAGHFVNVSDLEGVLRDNVDSYYTIIAGLDAIANADDSGRINVAGLSSWLNMYTDTSVASTLISSVADMFSMRTTSLSEKLSNLLGILGNAIDSTSVSLTQPKMLDMPDKDEYLGLSASAAFIQKEPLEKLADEIVSTAKKVWDGVKRGWNSLVSWFESTTAYETVAAVSDDRVYNDAGSDYDNFPTFPYMQGAAGGDGDDYLTSDMESRLASILGVAEGQVSDYVRNRWNGRPARIDLGFARIILFKSGNAVTPGVQIVLAPSGPFLDPACRNIANDYTLQQLIGKTIVPFSLGTNPSFSPAQWVKGVLTYSAFSPTIDNPNDLTAGFARSLFRLFVWLHLLSAFDPVTFGGASDSVYTQALTWLNTNANMNYSFDNSSGGLSGVIALHNIMWDRKLFPDYSANWTSALAILVARSDYSASSVVFDRTLDNMAPYVASDTPNFMALLDATSSGYPGFCGNLKNSNGNINNTCAICAITGFNFSNKDDYWCPSPTVWYEVAGNTDDSRGTRDLFAGLFNQYICSEFSAQPGAYQSSGVFPFWICYQVANSIFEKGPRWSVVSDNDRAVAMASVVTISAAAAVTAIVGISAHFLVKRLMARTLAKQMAVVAGYQSMLTAAIVSKKTPATVSGIMQGLVRAEMQLNFANRLATFLGVGGTVGAIQAASSGSSASIAGAISSIVGAITGWSDSSDGTTTSDLLQALIRYVPGKV